MTSWQKLICWKRVKALKINLFMNKIYKLILGVFCSLSAISVYAADKFDILPDLPEPLANAAQASSVTTNDAANTLTTQSIGQEPSLISIVFSLVFVVLLIYATGIIYAKLNKLGLTTLKKQMGENANSQVSVISTTPLGNNKSLHVVELDGKRMLIGASTNSIHLIKDLGSFPPKDFEEGEYSKIEIPNIRIPKIEIPKIEFPGFTKVVSKKAKEETPVGDTQPETKEDSDNFEISDIYVEDENSDGIIDKLFQTVSEHEKQVSNEVDNEHKVDPEEFALYKKYLG